MPSPQDGRTHHHLCHEAHHDCCLRRLNEAKELMADLVRAAVGVTGQARRDPYRAMGHTGKLIAATRRARTFLALGEPVPKIEDSGRSEPARKGAPQVQDQSDQRFTGEPHDA